MTPRILRHTTAMLMMIAVFSASLLRGQSPAYTNYTADEGLPGNQTYFLYQQPGGRLWIGTDQGLASYDGRQFKSYFSPSASTKAISPIVQDLQGTIWCSNFNGQVFYLENDSLKELNTGINNTGTVVKLFYLKKTGELFFNTREGIYLYNTASKTNRQFSTPEKRGLLHSMSDGESRCLLSNSQNIYLYENGIMRTVRTPEASFYSHGVIEKKLTFFCVQNTFHVYINDTKELFDLQGDTLVPNRGDISTADISGILHYVTESAGTLNLNTSQGLLLQKSPGETRKLFGDQNISYSLVDDEGGLWVCSLNNGLYYLPEPTTVVHRITAESPGPIFYNMLPSGNRIYLGAAKGKLYKLDLNTQKISLELETRDDDQINSMCEDTESGNLYIGSVNLFRYNPATRQLKKQRGLSVKDLTFHNGTLIMSDPSDVYAMSDGGNPNLLPIVVTYIPWIEQLMFRHLETLNQERSISHEYIPEKQEIWTCGQADLYCYKNKTLTRVKYPDGKPILGIWLSSYQGNVICATANNGVVMLKDQTVTGILNEEKGLISNAIKKIRVYGDELLIISNRGISMYNLISGIIRNFTESDGILSREVNDACLHRGHLYVASKSGIFEIDFKGKYFNTIAPRISLNSTWLNGRKISSPYREFEAQENNISFFLDAIALKAGKQLDIEYCLLLNGKGSWQKLAREQEEIRLNRLEPGKYQLLIRAFNEDRVPSKVVEAAKFVILKPLWYRGWFLVLMIVLIMLLFSLLYRWRLRQQENANKLLLEKSRIEKELQNSQLSSLKVQMNPHFLFNALNSIQEFILTNEKRLANQYLGKFSDLMRMTLDMSQEESVLLRDEIKVLKLYLELEELRFGKNLTIRFHIDPALHSEEIRIPSMLIQPFIENALKHGLLHRKEDRILSIDFLKKEGENVLLCRIDDNGIGRMKSAQMQAFRHRGHKSFASGATTRRLDLLNAGRANFISVHYTDKSNASGESEGTTVELEIPYQT